MILDHGGAGRVGADDELLARGREVPLRADRLRVLGRARAELDAILGARPVREGDHREERGDGEDAGRDHRPLVCRHFRLKVIFPVVGSTVVGGQTPPGLLVAGAC